MVNGVVELEELVDAAEAARYLGLARKTVYTWAEQGRLPAYRIGRALRFRVSELKDYIAASRLQPLTADEPSRNLPHQRTGTGSV